MTNRHERRKAAKTMRMERREISLDELEKMGFMCAWKGCMQTYRGTQPEDWRWLLMYGSPHPVNKATDIPEKDWDRDCSLCPAHARELDGLLMDIGGRLKGPVAGSA